MAWLTRIAALLAAGSVAWADVNRRTVPVPIVALLYGDDGGAMPVLRVVGVTREGAVLFRRRLDEARQLSYDQDTRLVVFAGPGMNDVVCLDRFTGREAWRIDRPGPDEAWVHMRIAGETLLLATQEPTAGQEGWNLKGVHLATGRPGRVPDARGYPSTSADGGILVIRDHASASYVAFEAATFERLWVQPVEQDDTVAFAGRFMYSRRGASVSLVEPRTLKRMQELGVSLPEGSWCSLHDTGDALLMTVQTQGRNTVMEYHAIGRDGRVAWTRAVDRASFFSGAGPYVVAFSMGAKTAEVLDVRTGVTAWSSPVQPETVSVKYSRPGGGRGSSSRQLSFAMADRAVWLMQSDRQQIAIHDLASGVVQGTVAPKGRVRNLQAHAGQMLVLTETSLSAHHLRTGAVLWSVETGVSVADGHLLVR